MSTSRASGSQPHGLPAPLQSGVERLSGLRMDDVAVHYNSARPAQVGAQAYTQGSAIHLGPGQEQHLPHEAWHVVQQKQQRVPPTWLAKGVAMNVDSALETEADAMGARASQAAGSEGAQDAGERARYWTGSPRPGGVVQAKGAEEELSPEAKAARDEIDLLSKPQNVMGRKAMNAKKTKELFAKAGVEISNIEAYNWIKFGKTHPWEQAAGGSGAAPSNFEPVRNNKVVDDWNEQMKAATGQADVSSGEVTTTGDGFQIAGMVEDSSGGGGRAAANPNVKRDPLHEKALGVMKSYDLVDRKKLQVNALFSQKPKDVELVRALQERGGYVANGDDKEVPVGATYVLAKTSRNAKGETLRQFVGTGIIVDKTAEGVTTMSVNDLGARTDSMLRQVRFTPRGYQKGAKSFAGQPADVELMGWFVPESMPQLGEMPGQKPGDLKDAYDQTHDVKYHWLDEAKQAEEGRKVALTGHTYMGADWHGAENYGYTLKQVQDTDEAGQPKFQKNKKGESVPVMKQVRVKVDKAVAKNGPKAQALAYKILAANPDKLRNPEDGSKGSYFTTCLATATKIVTEYGVDPNIFGGLLAPVFQDPKRAQQPRNTALFQYLKDSGGWLWGYSGFLPVQGDVILTGTYVDTVNVKDKSRGLWTFQHAATVANTMMNDDGTYTLLTQDGGKGMATIGEDKTGYTIRNYNPTTRLISGASPKMVIGVWRLPALKAALENMPQEIKDTLSKNQLATYERMFKPHN